MPDETREYMKNNILGALEGVKKIVNLYLVTYSLCIISTITRWKRLNEGLGDDPIEILRIKVYPHIYSLLFGILFLAFIIVLASRIDLLKITIKKYQKNFQNQTDSELITYYPWIASPFHQSRRGKVIFSVCILLGLGNVAWLSFAHFAGIGTPSWKIIRPCYYRYFIGSIDSIAFFISIVFLYRIRRGIQKIKEYLYYPEN